MTYRLPDGWREVRLGNVTGLKPGYAFKGTDFGAHNEKVIKIGNIKPPVVDYEALEGVDITNYDLDKINDYIAYEGDFVFAMTGATIGKIGRVCHNEAYVNQRVLLFQPTEDINKDYLYYSVIGNNFQSYVRNFVDSQTAQANISAKTLSKYKFYIPELSEQASIASTLSALDNKIELNNKINDNLEAQTQALFKHWFVDFEFPDENGNPYKSSGGTMVESEEGLIPKGWRIIELGDLCTRETLNVKFPQKGLFYHYSIPAYDSHKHALLENGLTIKSNKYHVDNNHVIFSRLNPIVKRLWRPICKGNNCICSTEFVVLKSKNDLNKGLLYSILDSQNFHNFCLENVTGATNSHQRVSPPGIILKYKLALPSAGSLEEFINYVNESHKIIDCNITQNQILSQLRDTLLPKLMSGEIRIPPEQ